MSDFDPYDEFFRGEWQALLDAGPAHWSWDRKACYLYYTATHEGTPQMATTPRKKPGRKAAQNQTAAALTAALDFLSVVPDKKDNPNSLVIIGNVASVNNGLVKAGIMVAPDTLPADIVTKVQLSTIRGALQSVGKDMEITFEDDEVTIQSGEFMGVIPTLEIDADNDRAKPDPSIAPLNDAFKLALGKVVGLVSDTAEELMMASIAVTGNTVLATRRHTIVEAWHGNDMPYGMIFLPKAFVQALMRTTAKIVSFGFGIGSFTVHFETGSYLQTNIFPNAWDVEGKEPGIALKLAMNALEDADGSMFPAPDVLFAALSQIAKVTSADVHATLGRLESVDGMVNLDVKEIGAEFVIVPQRFLDIAPLISTAKLVRDQPGMPARIIFWGEAVRGTVIVDRDRPAPNIVAASREVPAPAMGWAPQPVPLASAALAPATDWALAPATDWAAAPSAAPSDTSLAASTPPAPIASLSSLFLSDDDDI